MLIMLARYRVDLYSNAMSEIIKIPTARSWMLSDVVINALVEKGTLQPDILFRLLDENNPSDDQVSETIAQAILSDSPADLPYPNAVWIPHDVKIAELLGQIEEPYHSFRDFKSVSEHPDTALLPWSRIIAHCNPALSEQLASIRTSSRSEPGAGTRENQYRSAIMRTVVRDQTLLEMFERRESDRRIVSGLGRTAFYSIAALLADNHPELYPLILGRKE